MGYSVKYGRRCRSNGFSVKIAGGCDKKFWSSPRRWAGLDGVMKYDHLGAIIYIYNDIIYTVVTSAQRAIVYCC